VPLGGWHSASPNCADAPRQVLFYGYSYRWLRPRDDMTGARWIDRCDPIRAQLLGASPSGQGYLIVAAGAKIK
jgi:hypothetical protein